MPSSSVKKVCTGALHMFTHIPAHLLSAKYLQATQCSRAQGISRRTANANVHLSARRCAMMLGCEVHSKHKFDASTNTMYKRRAVYLKKCLNPSHKGATADDMRRLLIPCLSAFVFGKTAPDLMPALEGFPGQMAVMSRMQLTVHTCTAQCGRRSFVWCRRSEWSPPSAWDPPAK